MNCRMNTGLTYQCNLLAKGNRVAMVTLHCNRHSHGVCPIYSRSWSWAVQLHMWYTCNTVVFGRCRTDIAGTCVLSMHDGQALGAYAHLRNSYYCSNKAVHAQQH